MVSWSINVSIGFFRVNWEGVPIVSWKNGVPLCKVWYCILHSIKGRLHLYRYRIRRWYSMYCFKLKLHKGPIFVWFHVMCVQQIDMYIVVYSVQSKIIKSNQKKRKERVKTPVAKTAQSSKPSAANARKTGLPQALFTTYVVSYT